jgi:aspartyl-tRNA(Asn)/glutamyl-tRNA(Gln) amidotransferase subunit B
MNEFESVIGLEVHAEMLTRSKMFCGCAVVDSTRAEPNTSTCEICTGMPGTLPVINRQAVEFALQVALALHCEIAETSVFARKNYFYPDLPKGFQISQYELPLARNGWLMIRSDGQEKRIRIRRVHLEEDTGKLFHRDDYSLVDFNRSGVPLLEIVSEPDLRSIEETKSYAQALRSLLRYLEVNSGDMEKGVIRFEANVSVRPEGSTEFGIRTEIKNLNSFRALTRSVEYEIARQADLLASGGKVRQETVGWDEDRGITISQRGKEEAHDYRYFPEPDLPPLQIDPRWLDSLREALPEGPAEKFARFVSSYQLSPNIVGVLTDERAVADYFEAAVKAEPAVSPEKIANWIAVDYFSLLNQNALAIDQGRISPRSLASLVGLVESGTINATSAKVILSQMFTSGEDPIAIVESLDLKQISDPEVIDEMIQNVLSSSPSQVKQYLAGKETLEQWFFGQVMRAAKGKADPKVLRSRLESALAALEKNQPPS